MNENIHKTVIVDIDIPGLAGDDLFSPEKVKLISHTLLPLCYLFEKAKECGIQLITADTFFNLAEKPKNPLLLSYLQTRFSKKLRAMGARPVAVLCQESPYIASRFYLNIKRISKIYKHSFVFSGMMKKLDKNSQYHQMFFPSTFNIANFKVMDFSEKRFTTMVSSNKNISDWKKNIIMKMFYGIKVRCIYKERLAVIKYFGSQSKFDLFGFGWDSVKKKTHEYDVIKKVYKGSLADKNSTLQKYKFAFAFENAIFPGYITEKIFDVMFAGCVPIYYGAPDISAHIPADCFIDLRNFDSFSQLKSYLESIGEKEYDGYASAIRKFLSSEGYSRFTQEYFSEEILSILRKEFDIV